MTSDELRRQLEAAASLPEAITLLKDHYGSDDKLARHLETTRQTTIEWRLAGRFPRDFVDKLAAEGVPRRLLILPETLEELWHAQRQVEAQVLGLRRRLETLGPEPDA